MLNELSRKQVSLRLRCSIATVQRFEQEGRLHPRRDPEGHVWFSSTEVLELARTWRPKRTQPEKIDSQIIASNVRGKIAAKLLPMFKAGITDMAILCEATEADPLVVMQLYDAWKLGLEGAAKERERLRQEAIDREEQRRHDRETQRREWIAMRVKVAELEARGRKAG